MFLLTTVAHGQDTIPQLSDSLSLAADSLVTLHADDYEPVKTVIDTTRRTNYWHISPLTGVILPAKPDTFLTDYFNRTNMEGTGIAVAYLGNLGLPVESRVFFERSDRSEFMFFDHFETYRKTPERFQFTNTKVPFTNIAYQSSGSRDTKEERLQALMSINFGKSLNIGFDVDYLYARGYYKSQSAKHTDWAFFGNFISDRHQLHLLINPSSYTNAENGGIEDSRWITNPDEMDNRNSSPQNIPTAFSDTWNYINGQRYYLNYRHNLGFIRETDSVFVPVSSLLYTFDMENRKRRFFSRDSAALNSFYGGANHLSPLFAEDLPNDSTQWRSVRNVLGIALREGFSRWAKFDLTAYVRQDFRQFRLMDNDPAVVYGKKNITSTYLGGELAKRTGKLLRYNAEASLGLSGYNRGDIHASGKVETRIPFLGDTVSVAARGTLKNTSPAYYENHYHSRYLSWNRDFEHITRVFAGGELTLPQTDTEIGFGVENMTNYLYFGYDGMPLQYGGNIQVAALSVEQKIKLGALHFDNRAVFQTTSNDTILPLPAWSLYSSLFAEFKIAGVLTIQAGVNAHFWAKYYSPTYEPATQQFKIQRQTKVGEYPLLSGYLNCHLKQARFFIQYYNLAPMLIGSTPNYFSIPMYPVNPPGIRMGIAVDFHN
ncbi:MAG: putative porin [Dysgonamonadaceae bacterium]|nr:putative porin [Dysgonamonadaceae bacterium]